MPATRLDSVPLPTPLTGATAGFTSEAPAPESCAVCGARLAGHYFEIGHRRHCERCRNRAEEEHNDAGGLRLFGRAALWGSGAALFGGLLCFAPLASTGSSRLILSLIALPVAWLIGTVVRAGSREKGGVRFQILAGALSYLAFASPNTPSVLRTLREAEVKAALKIVARTVDEHPEKVRFTATGFEIRTGEGKPLSLVTRAEIWSLVFLQVLLAPFVPTPKATTIIPIALLLVGVAWAWRINRREELVILGPYSLDGNRGSSP